MIKKYHSLLWILQKINTKMRLLYASSMRMFKSKPLAGTMDKLIFTPDVSKITGQPIYNIQYVGSDSVPRYLGMIPADYLQTALWFYNQEMKMEIEIRGAQGE